MWMSIGQETHSLMKPELWLIHLAPGHRLRYLLLLNFFLTFIYFVLLSVRLCSFSPFSHALKFSCSVFTLLLFLGSAVPVTFLFFPILFFLQLFFSPPCIRVSPYTVMLSHSKLFVSTLLSSFVLSCTLCQCSQVARNQISGFSISFLLIPT